MVKIDSYTKVQYKGYDYAVFKLTYKNKPVPVIIDWNDFKIIKNLDKNWYINDSGMVMAHVLNDKIMEICLHELIMAFKCREQEEPIFKRSIVHINRLGIDNRRKNLLYDVTDKEINKNLRKKQRIISLPKNSGIDADDLPTYVWYLKPDSSHGERFIVTVGDVSWKTSSSNTLSLRYKLEEAKKYLRELKVARPDLFQNYSMNGDYNKNGLELLESFYKIVQPAGFNLSKINSQGSTDKYLEEDLNDLDDEEIQLLRSRSF